MSEAWERWHVRCARQRNKDTQSRCMNAATHAYRYLKMPICDTCTGIMREEIRRYGFDDESLICHLEDYTGTLYDGTVFQNGEVVTRGTERP